MKSIILCRVSSKEQEETGYSLPAQEKFLKEYADKHNYQVVKTFSISESASGSKQREIFSKMISFTIKQNIKVIICEKVDRFTRNFKDAVMLDEWLEKDPERQIHLVKDSLVLMHNSPSQQKLNWGIRILFAKNYIDNLSEEVKKGQKEKIAQGWLPTKPPPGYRTVGEKGHKIHIIDDKKAPIIRKMFDYFITGEYSVKKITDKIYQEGLTNDNGNKIVISRIHGLLTDPFYIGKIRWNNNIYDGKHDPLITQEVFSRVQEILKGRCTPKYSKHLYLYNKLIRCFECDGLITWETHKGITYGHCNHYRNCSQKSWSPEKEVDSQLIKGFNLLQLQNTRIADWIKRALKESHQDEIAYHSSAVDELYQQQKQLQQRLDRLYDDKLDEKINENFYQKKRVQYSESLNNITESLKKHNTANSKYYDFGINIFELSQKAKDLFLKAKKHNLIEEQRRLIWLVFANMQLNEGKLSYNYTPAFTLLSKAVSSTNSSKIEKVGKINARILEPQKKPDTMRKSGNFYPHQPNWLRG